MGFGDIVNFGMYLIHESLFLAHKTICVLCQRSDFNLRFQVPVSDLISNIFKANKFAACDVKRLANAKS